MPQIIYRVASRLQNFKSSSFFHGKLQGSNPRQLHRRSLVLPTGLTVLNIRQNLKYITQPTEPTPSCL